MKQIDKNQIRYVNKNLYDFYMLQYDRVYIAQSVFAWFWHLLFNSHIESGTC
jgi:hypothetical protein